MKKGRISKEEHNIIERHVNEGFSCEDIASILNRQLESVEEYVKRKFQIGSTREEEATYELATRPYYSDLKEQFTEEELKMFKYHWARFISQFNNDVFATEELQIVDAIKLELLMARCLKSNKTNIVMMNRLQQEVDSIMVGVVLDQAELDRVTIIERQLGSLRAAQESLNRDYRDLQTKKSSMLKEMKGTREQRVKRLEDARESFTAWVSILLHDPEKLYKYGIEMEKMRLAMENEKKRLGNYHKYEDGQIDRPLLNSKTVRQENE